ncbi:zinc finger protein 845 [Amyelois transitella]|uniref:zinc finger protein 845 n=1 Tax=Amyelois transitella TaxID=680683 RepID=UPI00299026B7|nr:zinc finger protein 845 [Amyelois transitella]
METDLNVNVKVEPESGGEVSLDENDSKPQKIEDIKRQLTENIDIKSEPIDDESCYAPENITVKLEPTYYSSGDEDIPLEYVAAQIAMRYPAPPRRRRRSDSDDEYIPPRRLKKKKKVREANVKPTYRGKSKKEENMLYSEEVTKHIEIITITEEQRQREIGETLNLRKNFAYRCEWCALGFVLEEAYDMHMKIHSPEAGEFECSLCRARVKSKTMLYRHRLRHYRRYRCAICLMIHKDKDTAASHVMTDHERQAFVCVECSRSFKRPRYLERHIEQHHTKLFNFQCPEPDCKRVFHERGRYRSHVRSHKEEIRNRASSSLVVCAVCGKAYKSKSCLKRHLQTHRATVCTLCCVPFPHQDALRLHYARVHNCYYDGCLKRHLQTHRATVCTLCCVPFPHQDALRLHYARVHNCYYDGCLKRHLQTHRATVCTLCCVPFPHQDALRLHYARVHNCYYDGCLKRHLQTHRATVCTLCCVPFPHQDALRLHYARVHNCYYDGCLKRHLQTHRATVCTLCCVPFPHQDALRLHYARVHNCYYDGVHIGEKCPHCGLVCGNNSLLNKHIKRMHKDRTKKYQCDYCQRLYLTKGEVRAHIMWSHEKRGGHACTVPGCGRVFRAPARLRSHTQVDHLGLSPPKNHECVQCGKGFINKQVLQRHMRVHSDEKYPCGECGVAFKTEPYVRVHYQRKHLNMTRAQIRDQVRLRKTQSINLFKPTVNEIKQAKVTPALDATVNSYIPMFETFVDVQRDILNDGVEDVKQEPGVEC